MKWHESKFWRATAVAALFLLGGILLQLGGAGQPVDAATAASGGGARLSELRSIGLVPWDLSRGTFVSISDTSDKIVVWELGADWQSSVTFKVIKSTVLKSGV